MFSYSRDYKLTKLQTTLILIVVVALLVVIFLYPNLLQYPKRDMGTTYDRSRDCYSQAKLKYPQLGQQYNDFYITCINSGLNQPSQ